MFEAIDKFRNHDGHISMDRVESNLILFQDVYHLMATVKSRPLIKIRSTWNADGVKNQPNIIPLLADSNNPELFFRPTWPFVLPFFWGTFRPSASFPVPFIPLTGILEHIFPTSSLQFIQTFFVKFISNSFPAVGAPTGNELRCSYFLAGFIFSLLFSHRRKTRCKSCTKDWLEGCWRCWPPPPLLFPITFIRCFISFRILLVPNAISNVISWLISTGPICNSAAFQRQIDHFLLRNHC